LENRRHRVRPVVWVCLFASTFGVATQAYADTVSGSVRVVYLVPSDRAARIDYLNVTTGAAEHLREWLWDPIGDDDVELRGRNQFISGHNFVADSTVIVDDQPRFTTLQDKHSVLTAHLQSDRLSPGDAVRVRVVNPDGMSTTEILFDIPPR